MNDGSVRTMGEERVETCFIKQGKKARPIPSEKPIALDSKNNIKFVIANVEKDEYITLDNYVGFDVPLTKLIL